VETLQGWKQQLVEIGTAVSAIRSTVVSAVVWALEHFDIIHFF
jgi:recombinational DNA repair ATPase RecF